MSIKRFVSSVMFLLLTPRVRDLFCEAECRIIANYAKWNKRLTRINKQACHFASSQKSADISEILEELNILDMFFSALIVSRKGILPLYLSVPDSPSCSPCMYCLSRCSFKTFNNDGDVIVATNSTPPLASPLGGTYLPRTYHPPPFSAKNLTAHDSRVLTDPRDFEIILTKTNRISSQSTIP